MHWNAMNIQRCAFFTSIAAPDQRPMIRCQRMHRESIPWDFFSRSASVPEKTQAAACGGRGKTRAAGPQLSLSRTGSVCAGWSGNTNGSALQWMRWWFIGLSGREVIELLGRYICSTFSFSRRTLHREAGLVLKNVANLCRYTYLEGTYLAAVDK